MVYLPLTPTTYPHTLTYNILINMDVSLKGSTLRPGAETLSPGTGGHTGYAGGHKGPHPAPQHPRPYGMMSTYGMMRNTVTRMASIRATRATIHEVFRSCG